MKKQLFGFLLCLALVLSLLPAAVQATGGIPAVPLSSMQHTHTPSDWQGDQQSHYKVCTGCGETLETQPHTGGKATCVEKGKCTVCGYAYLPENEDHVPDTEWTACAGLYHAKLCKLCGAHCTPEEHEAGPTGTPNTDVVCRVCGYIMIPAKEESHTHKLTLKPQVPATCLQDGTAEHYACSGCSGLFADKAGKQQIDDPSSLILQKLGHAASDNWSRDDTYHWRSCKNCQLVMEETKLPHALQNRVCTACGYQTGEETVAPTETEQTDPPAPRDRSAEPIPWGIWVAVILVCITVGIVTAVLLVKRKEK